MSSASFEYIDTQDGLDRLVGRLRNAPRLAVDTEADSLHHYFEKVCLIQLSFGKETVLVDPLAGLNFKAFFRELSEKPLIFHGAEYDLRMLRASHKFRPKAEVFDTMIAAQLVEGEARSLLTLADKYLGVTLTKSGQRSDWSKRPLTEKQLSYAANDTRYLERIADRLAVDLEKLGRAAWHRQSCKRMVKATGVEKPEPDPNRVWRIKGLSGMDRKQLAYVREIWRWRDAEAREVDLPPFKVMGNSLLLELVEWATAGRRTPRNMPKLPRNLVGRRRETLDQAISRAASMSEEELPDFLRGGGYAPVEPGPELDRLRAACDQIAEDLGLQSSLIASRKQLEAIALAKPTGRKQLQAEGHLMDWQADLLLPIVNRILNNV